MSYCLTAFSLLLSGDFVPFVAWGMGGYSVCEWQLQQRCSCSHQAASSLPEMLCSLSFPQSGSRCTCIFLQAEQLPGAECVPRHLQGTGPCWSTGWLPPRAAAGNALTPQGEHTAPLSGSGSGLLWVCVCRLYWDFMVGTLLTNSLN